MNFCSDCHERALDGYSFCVKCFKPIIVRDATFESFMDDYERLPLSSLKYSAEQYFGRNYIDPSVTVDKDNYEKLRNYAWKLGSNNRYVLIDWDETTPLGVNELERMGFKRGSDIWIHRLITDCPKGMEVDHKNHNPLDNTRSNLRICTPFQNKCNKRINYRDINNGSIYRGISKIGFLKGYKVQLEVEEGLYKDLGTYKNEKDAIRAYNQAAISHHKEYCQLNQYQAEDIKWGELIFAWMLMAFLIYSMFR
jgi:hypothetical protein